MCFLPQKFKNTKVEQRFTNKVILGAINLADLKYRYAKVVSPKVFEKKTFFCSKNFVFAPKKSKIKNYWKNEIYYKILNEQRFFKNYRKLEHIFIRLYSCLCKMLIFFLKLRNLRQLVQRLKVRKSISTTSTYV